MTDKEMRLAKAVLAAAVDVCNARADAMLEKSREPGIGGYALNHAQFSATASEDCAALIKRIDLSAIVASVQSEQHPTPQPAPSSLQPTEPSDSTKCSMCNGHGLVGGLLPGDGGYQSDVCTDCGGSGVQSEQHAKLANLRKNLEAVETPQEFERLLGEIERQAEAEDEEESPPLKVNVGALSGADGLTEQALYTRPQPTIPPGRKLVPMEPTEEMYWAVADGLSLNTDYEWFCDIYHAMIAAAPEHKEG